MKQSNDHHQKQPNSHTQAVCESVSSERGFLWLRWFWIKPISSENEDVDYKNVQNEKGDVLYKYIYSKSTYII